MPRARRSRSIFENQRQLVVAQVITMAWRADREPDAGGLGRPGSEAQEDMRRSDCR